jgi:hypothetical protein
MKIYYFAFSILLGMASCQQNRPEKDSNSSDDQENTDPTDTTVVETEALKTYDYYGGTIGEYEEDVLIEINKDELALSGRYWYLKHGKPIQLQGDASSKANEWQLTEKSKNAVTGHMTLQLKGDSLIGQWYAPGKKSAVQKVVLKKISTSEAGQIEPKFEDFSFAKTISIYDYDTDESKDEEASDDIRLVRMGDYVLFQYFVIGSNAHFGHLHGLAKLQNPNKAMYYGEEGCELSMTFSKDQVVMAEDEDCSYMRGMRAHFGATLKRVN